MADQSLIELKTAAPKHTREKPQMMSCDEFRYMFLIEAATGAKPLIEDEREQARAELCDLWGTNFAEVKEHMDKIEAWCGPPNLSTKEDKNEAVQQLLRLIDPKKDPEVHALVTKVISAEDER